MLFARVAAATLLLVSSPAPAPPMQTTARPLPKVTCPAQHIVGSAFRVGPRLLVTAKHVAARTPCAIEGRAMKVLYASPDSDFAEIEDSADGPGFRVDCSGFIEGRKYIGLGHGRGVDEIVPVAVIATGETLPNGLAILVGMFTFVPGMSGGVVIDAETGAAVGIVNASNWELGASASLPLKSTPICGGNDAKPV